MTGTFKLCQFLHHSCLWHKLVYFDLLFKFFVEYIIGAIFLDIIYLQSSYKGLLSGQHISGLLSILVLFEFYEFSITEWNFKCCTVSDRCSFCRYSYCCFQILNLFIYSLQMLNFCRLLTLNYFFGSFKIDWCWAIHVLLNLIDLKKAVNWMTILWESKSLFCCCWIIW